MIKIGLFEILFQEIYFLEASHFIKKYEVLISVLMNYFSILDMDNTIDVIDNVMTKFIIRLN